MESIKILWVDDEIEMLKPHFLFLEDRGYTTTPCTNGQDALDLIEANRFDVILLDENMPGLNGLETLAEIKNRKPNLPVVMITKNEEEQIMEDAIGSKISDYLIKPVNPHQILLSLKKILNQKNLVAEKTTQSYQQEFRKISQSLMDLDSYDDWIEYFKKLMYWELELETLEDKSLFEIFETQMKEANSQFAKFISSNYTRWIQDNAGPTLSHKVFQKHVVPELRENKPTLLILIDNLRFDQWKTIEPEIRNNYTIEQEHTCFSILPTATQYARNAFFSGLTPLEIQKKFPKWWKNDTEEGGKNLYEKELLEAQCERLNFKRPISYHKITQLQHSQQLIKNLQNHTHEGLTAVVYNFVDMISHAKTEMEVIKELAPDNKAYRSITLSWYRNSPLKELLKKAASLGFKVLLTTDHGTINVGHPSAVMGDRETSLNLRYKTGKSLTYDPKDVLECKDPKDFHLPAVSINSPYIFAEEDYYFVYKNNYNHFVNFFKNTFQHGGVSMEEMIIPFVVLSPR
ncbi:bifunctional response regulator/alkaline phosphatase family protein [Flavobacteriaceae bacterium]|jgi:DNA-binding response OmpR family regulator|nr:PglZ domain-containing protein [Flavobacteriaceae bacterium]MBT7675506.1 PglZ domain-containing protein [Flavobacteriaceae bacterium]MDA9183325.1 bifunctional response regulator/alkaline phosphatase family protein [Flavobacteriaceae bacterium]MDA9305359.1 bifunctional response regulator/alkaline phosphatase family protein [Flavobacteriaceae bacterium]MDA9768572.1 bifunctional response regulator/alkaline phosphatase family protein [Flavobacteriaceae bacterium]